jgi:hypothetical protein
VHVGANQRDAGRPSHRQGITVLPASRESPRVIPPGVKTAHPDADEPHCKKPEQGYGQATREVHCVCPTISRLSLRGTKLASCAEGDRTWRHRLPRIGFHRLRRSGPRAASIFSGAVDLGFIAVAVLILLTPNRITMHTGLRARNRLEGRPSDAGRGPMPKDPRDRARRNSDIVPHRVIDSDPVPQPPLPARMPNGED